MRASGSLNHPRTFYSRLSSHSVSAGESIDELPSQQPLPLSFCPFSSLNLNPSPLSTCLQDWPFSPSFSSCHFNAGSQTLHYTLARLPRGNILDSKCIRPFSASSPTYSISYESLFLRHYFISSSNSKTHELQSHCSSSRPYAELG